MSVGLTTDCSFFSVLVIFIALRCFHSKETNSLIFFLLSFSLSLKSAFNVALLLLFLMHFYNSPLKFMCTSQPNFAKHIKSM